MLVVVQVEPFQTIGKVGTTRLRKRQHRKRPPPCLRAHAVAWVRIPPPVESFLTLQLEAAALFAATSTSWLILLVVALGMNQQAPTSVSIDGY